MDAALWSEAGKTGVFPGQLSDAGHGQAGLFRRARRLAGGIFGRY